MKSHNKKIKSDKTCRSHLIINILLPLFVIYPQLIIASPIYHWIDKAGKAHFSDTAKSSRQISLFNPKPIASVKIVKTKKIKIIRTKRTKYNRKSSNKKTDCEKLKIKILKLESTLKKRLLASKADHYNHQLKNMRWKKIKKC